MLMVLGAGEWGAEPEEVPLVAGGPAGQVAAIPA